MKVPTITTNFLSEMLKAGLNNISEKVVTHRCTGTQSLGEDNMCVTT